MQGAIDIGALRRRIEDELPARTSWFLHDGNDPLRYSFADSWRGLPLLSELLGDDGIPDAASLRVFGGYEVEGGASPLLAIDVTNGEVKEVDVEQGESVLLLNSSMSQFIATFRYFDEHLRGGLPMPDDALEVLKRIDAKAVAPGAPWPAFLDHVREARASLVEDGAERVSVRNATGPDLDQVLRWSEDLTRLVHEREGADSWLAGPPKLTRDRVLELLEDPRAVLIVAALDGRLVGFAHAEVRDRYPALAPSPVLHVEAVFVAIDARRRGAGSALLAGCRAWGRARGLSSWSATVHRWNDAALALCARAGLWAKTAGLAGRL